MDLRWWQELVQWWLALPPLFVYLFALPFVIAVSGLVALRLERPNRRGCD